MLQHLVAHEAAVDEEILRIAAGLGIGRVANEPGQRQRAGHAFHSARAGGKLVAQHVGDTLGAGFAFEVQRNAAVVREGERHVRPRQGNPAHHFRAMGKLGLLALEELAPRRHVAKQLFHLDNGTFGQGRRARLA